MSLSKTKSVYIALGVATCALLLQKLYRSKFRPAAQHVKNPETKLDDDEEAIEIMTAPFQQAASLAITLRNMDQNDQLMLYGLYKQAIEGNAIDSCKEPNKLNIIAWKKYSAWRKFHSMPRHFAMMKYIEVVEHLNQLEHSRSKHGSADASQLLSSGGGSEAVLDMMNDSDIDYGDESSVDLSESSDSEKYSRRSFPQPDIKFGVKQSTLDCHVKEEYKAADTGIMQAAATGDVQLLSQLLLSGEVDVDEKDENGQTALHMAADRGMVDCVNILLQAGADPNAADKEGISVLEAAVIGGSVAVVKILLDAGADPDQQDKDGDTPRTCAEDDENDDMKALLRTAKSVDAMNISFGSLKSQVSQFSC